MSMRTVADSDLQIRGGGGGHPDPKIRGEARSPKIFFSALRPFFWSKNKGEGRTPPLDPPLQDEFDPAEHTNERR